MPKGTNQKLKLSYLSRIMTEKTDDEHFLSMPQIQELLEGYGVTADRKSIYSDFEALRVLGIDVIGRKEGKVYTYRVGKKLFDIAELKLLVDAVQSSKFITEKKSRELIKKLTGFASEYEASQLKRQVVVQGRVKTMNESIYYNVDAIHRAISENQQIEYCYMKWNADKELKPKRDETYVVSPWALTWANENYYLIAFDAAANEIKHYRVDKMKNIRTTGEKRLGRDEFKEFDIANYTKMNFEMFHGETKKVKIAITEDLIGAFIDRFGKDIPIRTTEKEGWYETSVNVAVSELFLGWIFALGQDAKILGPDDVVEKFREDMENRAKLYS